MCMRDVRYPNPTLKECNRKVILADHRLKSIVVLGVFFHGVDYGPIRDLAINQGVLLRRKCNHLSISHPIGPLAVQGGVHIDTEGAMLRSLILIPYAH